MELKSVPTRGRTLDHAAFVYDTLEPLLLLGKHAEYDRHIVSMLNLKDTDKVLDLGCGTGVLTRMIADRLNADAGGKSVGIDAAANMIKVARKNALLSTACLKSWQPNPCPLKMPVLMPWYPAFSIIMCNWI